MSGLQVSSALHLPKASDLSDIVHMKWDKAIVDQGVRFLSHLKHKQPCFLVTVPHMGGLGLGALHTLKLFSDFSFQKKKAVAAAVAALIPGSIDIMIPAYQFSS